MQRFALAAFVLGGCLENPTVEVDTQSLDIPRGTHADILVSIDGVPVTDLSEVVWTVDHDQLATVTRADDGYHLRVGGNYEGRTVVHVHSHGQDVAIETRIGPPAILRVWTEPATISAAVGSHVQVRAKALDTLARVEDVTFASRWAVRDSRIVDLDEAGMMLHATDAGQTTLHVMHGDANAVVPVAIFK